MVMGVTTNCDLRFLGRRNMKVTCFATILQGTGGWRNTEVRFPGLAGYHLSETQTCWYLGGFNVWQLLPQPREAAGAP